MITIVLVWTVAFFFANLFECWPLWVNWTNFGTAEGYCVNTTTLYLAQAWSDVLTDGKVCLDHQIKPSNLLTAIILTLPLPCVSSPFHVSLVPSDQITDLGHAIAS